MALAVWLAEREPPLIWNTSTTSYDSEVARLPKDVFLTSDPDDDGGTVA